jgi:hypothetical protein
MMGSAQTQLPERIELGAGSRRVFSVLLFVGGAAMVLALLVGFFTDNTLRRFHFAYLTSFLYFLSIALGALFFVLLQHVTRAGWSVSVRRIAENLAAALPVLAALAAPIVVSVMVQNGSLYKWAIPLHAPPPHVEPAARTEPAPGAEIPAPAGEVATSHVQETSDEHFQQVLQEKRAYLNPAFFVGRVAVYFFVWCGLGIWYWRRSTEQDISGDITLSNRMQGLASPALVAYALTVTLGSFDLIMSLDPTWYSTMFGVYYFSGAAVAIFAALIVLVAILQKLGYLTRSVTVEHRHDLGKFLFAFTFFWGYIAFSQFMLIWYASIPEETAWYARRGATSNNADINAWTIVSLILLFGHLLIPFVGLLSRHIKRRQAILVFWAGWMLVFHWIDIYWLVMPEYDGRLHLGIVELLCFVGIGAIYLAAVLRIALRHTLRPAADPRLVEALAFQNI